MLKQINSGVTLKTNKQPCDLEKTEDMGQGTATSDKDLVRLLAEYVSKSNKKVILNAFINSAC